jgi:peroxiredoxin
VLHHRLPSRRKRWAVDLAVLVVLFTGMHLYRNRGSISGVAPELSGTGVDGSALSLSALRGQPVLVQFWATWCGVCHQEQGTVDALSKDHPILTVAVSSGEPARVASFESRQGLKWPVLNDPDGAIAARWGVNAYPTSVILDGSGKVRFVEVGYTTEMGLRARLWLAGLFGRS